MNYWTRSNYWVKRARPKKAHNSRKCKFISPDKKLVGGWFRDGWGWRCKRWESPRRESPSRRGNFWGDGFIDRTFRGLGFWLCAVDFMSILSQDCCVVVVVVVFQNTMWLLSNILLGFFFLFNPAWQSLFIHWHLNVIAHMVVCVFIVVNIHDIIFIMWTICIRFSGPGYIHSVV